MTPCKKLSLGVVSLSLLAPRVGAGLLLKGDCEGIKPESVMDLNVRKTKSNNETKLTLKNVF